MKGLGVSRRFFEEWGLPWLRAERPDLVDRVAAGRCGRGLRQTDWAQCSTGGLQ